MASFVAGAMIGLGFHREGFLGGHNAFRPRLLRLGHIALAALGMMNVLYRALRAVSRVGAVREPTHGARLVAQPFRLR